MADSSPLPSQLDRTVETALKAYDDGYRIIAGWFNEAFDAWKIGARIEADPPLPGVTLDDCRRRLSNALLGIRPLCPDLDSDDQLCPWVVGYLCAERDQPGDHPGGIGLRDSPLSPWGSAEAVKNIVAVKHGYGWKKAGQWRAYVVEPMEQNARSWREWLLRIKTADDLCLDKAADILEQVHETTPSEAGSKRRGRKKADYQTVQREAQLAADWERARESGVYKADFAGQNGMKMRQLDALLNRVAKRKSRSDK